jgi:tRNA(adenine34) deaminase
VILDKVIVPDLINYLMDQAIEIAKVGASNNEVPVGAVIWHENQLIAKAHNQVESNYSATKHAEIIAIDFASNQLANWRLSNSILCVTLEPCTMCLGAIILSRIPVIIFGSNEPNYGAINSKYNLLLSEKNRPRIIQGIKEQECSELISNFFKKKRELI